MTTMPSNQIREGNYTNAIYTLIKKKKYNEAIGVLTEFIETNSKSRAALSLLAYCYYEQQDYVQAADTYEKLSLFYPKICQYRINYAQSLLNACLYDEALRVISKVEEPEFREQAAKLRLAVYYAKEDINTCMALLMEANPNDPTVIGKRACLCFKDGRYQESLQHFEHVVTISGSTPELSYNIAVCHYKLQQYAVALRHIAEVVERGINDHPEFTVSPEEIDVQTVGNSIALYNSALVEALNLKAAIEYQLSNNQAAKDAIASIPPRLEEELDPITLHNTALVHMETEPTQGFEKLQYLLQLPTWPEYTFSNILILYLKYGHYDVAADVIAANEYYVQNHLSGYLREFLDAALLSDQSPEEAYHRFEALCGKQAEMLKQLGKEVQECRSQRSDDLLRRKVDEYDEALELFIPLLMQQAKIYWDVENYKRVEQIFRASVQFCNEHESWRLNVAHVLFMQEKYKEAISFYEPLVKKNYENTIEISAIILANLCVSYIMINRNEEAEEIMRKIEKDEVQACYDEPNKRIYHLCIVNLVIGTLYCSKGNYEFGLSRVMKSMEPYQKKLSVDTWFYTKITFLSFINYLTRQLIMSKDSLIEESIIFLEYCEEYGQQVPANLNTSKYSNPAKNTVSYEARLLRSFLLRFLD